MLAFWLTANRVLRNKDTGHHVLIHPMQNKPGFYVSQVFKFGWLGENKQMLPAFKMYAKEHRVKRKIYLNFFPQKIGDASHGTRLLGTKGGHPGMTKGSDSDTRATARVSEESEAHEWKVKLRLLKVLKDEFDLDGFYTDAECHKLQIVLDHDSTATSSALHVRFGRLFYRILVNGFFFDDLCTDT